MMRMHFVLLFICTLVILASCKDQYAPVIQKKEPSGTLTVWIHKHMGYLKEYLQASLEKRFPDTKFDFIGIDKYYFLDTGQSVRIDDLIGHTSEMPDLIISTDNTLPYFTDRGLLDNLEPLLPGSQVDTGILNPPLLDAIKQYDNYKRLVALPLNQELYALFYNKKLFEQMNLPVPKDGMTWEELLAVSQQVVENNNKWYFPLDSGIGSQVMMQELSTGYIDPDSKQALIKSEQWHPILTFTDRLNRIGEGINPTNSGTSFVVSDIPGLTYLFGESNVAMAIGGLESNWLIENTYTKFYRLLDDYGASDHFVHQFWDLDWDVASVPTFDGTTGPSPSFSFVTVGASSHKKKEAMQVVSFLVSDDFQHELAKRAWGPALKGKDWQSVFASAYPNLGDKNMQAFFQYDPAPYRKWNLFETWDVWRWVTYYTLPSYNIEKENVQPIEKLEAMVKGFVSQVQTSESSGVD